MNSITREQQQAVGGSVVKRNLIALPKYCREQHAQAEQSECNATSNLPGVTVQPDAPNERRRRTHAENQQQ
jgi:hypothetical protein